MTVWHALFAALGLVSTAYAGISKQCPSPDLCFSLNIPDASISSGSGTAYLQITGPTTYSWIGIAQGEQMKGAQFIVLYTSVDGKNVTVSPRAGDDLIPILNPGARLELLKGSGVENGIMTANIKCINCSSWAGDSLNHGAQPTSWTWAHLTGDAINSDDVSIPLRRPDLPGNIAFDSTALSGSDTNSFRTQYFGTRAAPPTTPTGEKESPAPNGADHIATPHTAPKRIVHMYTAHGILACLAWVAIFPIGGIMIRLLSFPRLLWVHAGLQITGYCLYIAAMVLGILLSINPKFWRMHDKHVIIGLILFVSFFFQGITGYVHHLMYKKEGRRTAVSFIHLWTGRVCITLAMINAGFGFQLTHKGTGTWQVKTYTVFAVVMWVLYVVSIVVGERRKRRQAKERTGANIAAVNGSTSDSGGSRSSVRREHEVMGGEKYMAEDRA